MSSERDGDAVDGRNAVQHELEPLDRWLQSDGAVWQTHVASNERLNAHARALPAARISQSPENTGPRGERGTTSNRTSIGRQRTGRMLRLIPAVAAVVVVALMAALLKTTSKAPLTIASTATPTAPTATQISQGTLVWRHQTGQLLFGSPTVADGGVYLGGSDANMYAFDAQTGASRWMTQASAIIQTPAVAADGLVYVTGIDGQISAFQASTGAPAWSRRLTQQVFSSPIVVGNIIYAGASDHYLYALDARTGTTLSRSRAGGPLIFTPVVVDGIAYFTSHDDSPNPNAFFAYAVRLTDGMVLWHVLVDGYALAVASGIVYVGGGAPGVTALRASTGAMLWSYSLAHVGPVGATAPVVAGDLVYAGGDGVSALDAVTGKLRWTYPTGSMFAAPIIANGVLYAGSMDGVVAALDARTGSPRWIFATGGNIESTLAVAGGLVYVGANRAGVYALKA